MKRLLRAVRRSTAGVSTLWLVSLAGCGGGEAHASAVEPPVATIPASASAAPSAFASTPEGLSHAESCRAVDAAFALRRGEGAFTPGYGFGPPPRRDEVAPFLARVRDRYGATKDKLDLRVRERGDALGRVVEARLAVVQQPVPAASAPTAATVEAGAPKKKTPAQIAAARQGALREAAEYGMLGILGGGPENAPLDEVHQKAFLGAFFAFYDECATDLGVSAKEQEVFRALMQDDKE